MKANTARQIKSSIILMMNAVNSQDSKSVEKYNNAINIAIYLKGHNDPIIKAMGEKMLSLI